MHAPIQLVQDLRAENSEAAHTLNDAASKYNQLEETQKHTARALRDANEREDVAQRRADDAERQLITFGKRLEESTAEFDDMKNKYKDARDRAERTEQELMLIKE